MKAHRILVSSFILAASLATALAQQSEWKMANGLEVLHIRRPSSKVLASVVTVNVGSRDETADTAGLSHLLEHMVFDGTPRRTRAEINEGSKRFGGYVNATTRNSHTSYISIFPVEYADLSLDLQADMLFNSLIPEQELEKERKVVIEEMKRDRDAGANLAAEKHDELLFAGTSYARPVLGSEQTINSVPRAAVLDYYRSHYIPSRMRALILSPLPESEIRPLLEKSLGSALNRNVPPIKEPQWTLPKQEAPLLQEGAVPSAYLHFTLAAPSPGDPDSAAYDLLTRYLSEGGSSPLQKAVRQGKPPLADNLSTSLDVEPAFSVWKITAVTQPGQIPDLLDTFRRTLQRAAVEGIPAEDLQRLQQQVRSQEAILWEQAQYFGFMKAPMINALGLRGAVDYPNRLRKVTPADVARVAERYFTNPMLFTTGTVPKGKLPAADTSPESQGWKKELLPNGLMLVAQGSDDSEVFAITVFGRQRSALEAPDQEGISDFVQRMLLRGTETRSAELLQQQLDRLSAQIQYVDNPFIPYDDHYTNNRFTFFRLEVLDEARKPALEILSDLFGQASFPETEIDKVRQEIQRLQMREADSSAKRASQRLRELLLPFTPFAKPILGSSAGIGKISRTQLQEHYRRLYTPPNILVVAAGKGTTASLLRDLRNAFGNLKGGPPTMVGVSSPQVPAKYQAEHITADKQQTQFSTGTVTPGWGSPDAVALRLLNAILSERLAVELRETQGLAYSVVADLQLDQDYGWLEVRMGTRAESAEQARQGILAVVKKLAGGEVTAEELERAVNGIWGSTLRQRLSRIGQTFYRGWDEIRFSGFDTEERLLAALRVVKIEELQRLAKAHLDTEHWVLVSLGK